MAYNDILQHADCKENNPHGHDWKFCTILGHTHTPHGHASRHDQQ